MSTQWDDNQPIYRQLRDLIVRRILDGSFSEGEAIPSVRQVASDFRINHLTVSRAYQSLVDEGLLEMKRGLGMFVTENARERLLESERDQFRAQELPAFIERVQALRIDTEEIIHQLRQTRAGEQ
jgi:GntR family transcriptional regulator